MTDNYTHESVLLQRAVDALVVSKTGIYIDCTFGRGGHSQKILSCLDTNGKLYALDRDPQAVAAAEPMMSKDDRLVVQHGNFNELADFAAGLSKVGEISGVLFDLGVSSPQLDDASRGFSFMHDGPLDMRMDNSSGVTAEQWLSRAKEEEITEIFFRFGEEKFARRMSRAIVTERAKQRITTTGQLAELVKNANPAWERDKHPATRAFQAIRIYINDELGAISQGLNQALEILSIGGRLVVISFHSLEDKIVKKFMSLQTKGDNFPRSVPVRHSELNPRLKLIGKPIRASVAEIEGNPRSRSAILRVAEKIA
jgi:16S rRNA (cytosine1402-N4)-methyltransferase